MQLDCALVGPLVGDVCEGQAHTHPARACGARQLHDCDDGNTCTGPRVTPWRTHGQRGYGDVVLRC